MVVALAYGVRSLGTLGIGVAYGFDAAIRASAMRRESQDVRADGETTEPRHSASSYGLAISGVASGEQDSSGVAKRSKRLHSSDFRGHPI